MRKFNFKQSLLLMVAAMLVSGVASAGLNPKNGEDIFTGKKVIDGVTACNTCHGESAQGNNDLGAPRLANIGYGYMVKQLTNFACQADDKCTLPKRNPEGAGAVMPGFANALSEQERKDVAAYVNSLPDNPKKTGDAHKAELKALKDGGQTVGDSYKGAQIVTQGKGSISACTSCHDYNGRGVDPMFPKIGQQEYVYLVNQLTNWRAGAEAAAKKEVGGRQNDPQGMMRAVAKTMTDEDIHNLAAYLTLASPTRGDSHGGGDAVPSNDSLLHAVEK